MVSVRYPVPVLCCSPVKGRCWIWHGTTDIRNTTFPTFCIFMALKAIHNKDYSVVKTFKAALVNFNVVFPFLNVSRTPIKKQ